jgi:hypothetical protein
MGQIKWDYTLNLSKLHQDYHNKKIDFNTYIELIIRDVMLLKDRVNDKILKNELESWIEDMGYFLDGKFVCVLDEDEVDEIEYRFEDLYDIGDAKKRIWFGVKK